MHWQKRIFTIISRVLISMQPVKRKMQPSVTGPLSTSENQDILETSAAKSASRASVGKSHTTEKRVTKAPIINSPEPGPSRYIVSDNSGHEDSADMSDDFDDDPRTLCCVCHRISPENLNLEFAIEFAQWGQCETCSHWTHLKYCSNVSSAKRGSLLLSTLSIRH